MSFLKRKSTFTPSAGRDTYLDFYIEAIHQEIFNSLPKKSRYTIISEEELKCLQRLSIDPDIIIKKADEPSTIVIMDLGSYIQEFDDRYTMIHIMKNWMWNFQVLLK